MHKLPDKAKYIIDTLRQAGFEGWAVGGSVRDLLTGRDTKSWDFTTNATPEQILTVFPESFYDNQFGTVGVKIYDQMTDSRRQTADNKEEKPVDIYEITTYRSEKGYTDHRHPDKIVWGKTLEEDLSRRDFTINAIAFDGHSFVDPYDGKGDLQRRVIRAVGDPGQRFTEDALRIMRAVRIASEMGFMIEPATFAAISDHVKTLAKISAERIRDELLKLLASDHPADGILILKNSGILNFIMPEFIPAFETDQKSPKRHHVFDVGTHSIEALRHCPSKDPVTRLATLIHDIGKPITAGKTPEGVLTFYNHEVAGARIARKIAARLKLSNKQTEKLILLVRWHQFTVDERQTDTALRRFIRHVKKEHIDDMLALRIGDRLGGGARETSWRLELFKRRLEEVQKQPFTIADLAVNGFDVMNEFNSKPGPLIGTVLKHIFSEVEDAKIANTREALLERLKQLHETGTFTS